MEEKINIRDLFAGVRYVIRHGIHSKEDLVHALRIRRELKRVQDEEFKHLTSINSALADVEIETHKHDQFLDEPLHPVRPNVRRGSIEIDGKKLFLVETEKLNCHGEKYAFRLWMREE